MKHERFSTDVWQRLQRLEQEGNFNSFIVDSVEHYEEIRPMFNELAKTITACLLHKECFISPETANKLRELPETVLRQFGLQESLKSYCPMLPKSTIGRIHFPVVTSNGLVREIHVQKSNKSNLSSIRLQQFDRIGSAVFAVLEKKLGHSLFWAPKQYFFSAVDGYGRDDHAVEGCSMDLALAVALYSHVTQIPVPVDISATAEVKRDGAICSVEGLKEKIRALRQERYFVGHILISKKQETDSDPGLDLIRTGSVKDALDIVFTSTIDPTLFTAEIDIDAEMIKIRSQYNRYLIDTCIRNTKRMTQYLESRKCPLPEKQILHALFTCYWRRGSCHCHKGNVKKADKYLKKAHSLYRKHSGIILPNEYLNSEINFAVTLKDIFRYKEAKALHLKVQEEIERIGSGLDYENGKNLSSLSQLYLAECNFEEAEKYQRNALKFIPEHEIHRNLNYLAQILFRSKRFRSAKTCLNRSRELIEQTGKNRQKNLNFFNWFLSEYLYRKGMSLKQRPQKIKNFKDLHLLASKYPDINGYVPALIHKFSALALLEQGIRQEGMDKLDLVIQYFNAQNSPIFRLLGVSASVEKALYLLKYNDLPDAAESLKDIRKNLKLQKDVHHYFSKELKELSRYLRFKNPGEDKIKAVCSALEALGRKIPY